MLRAGDTIVLPAVPRAERLRSTPPRESRDLPLAPEAAGRAGAAAAASRCDTHGTLASQARRGRPHV
jgi:hypothetical protein